ncbi:MAG: alpha-ketoglutarate-dependent dioxygenase AlkB [Rhizobiaceae bacterium]|nr:alpha-ketoglutarate-dependent dioxygenase AlkB [Hyphomicrobiales bacterium]NRB30923.1 alpha-ketoglutarate-dependent dioxygenase AlkB [Rhizobiaceae bacterium]
MNPTVEIIRDGVKLWPGYFDLPAQQSLLQAIRSGTESAPLFTPKMPRTGKEMSVRMTNFGSLGWVTDKENGYRYQAMHPVSGEPWPEIPDLLLNLWSDLADYPHPPEACLVNYYDDAAKMGLHQDRDEEQFEAPVLSVSLGNDCLFRVGGTSRGGKTQSFRLRSGDVMMLTNEARLAFHGVDRIYPDTSPLLKQGGRVNLTLRRVTAG